APEDVRDRCRFHGCLPNLAGSRVFGQDVCIDLIGIGQPVHLIIQPDHGQDFTEGLVVQAEFLHRGSVAVDAVGAAVGRGHGQRDDLLGEQVDLAGLHDGLEPGPAQFEVLGMRREGAPDVGYPVDVLRRLDVCKHALDDRVRVVLVHQFHSRHGLSSHRKTTGILGRMWETYRHCSRTTPAPAMRTYHLPAVSAPYRTARRVGSMRPCTKLSTTPPTLGSGSASGTWTCSLPRGPTPCSRPSSRTCTPSGPASGSTCGSTATTANTCCLTGSRNCSTASTPSISYLAASRC